VGIIHSLPISIDELEQATVWYDQGRTMFEGSAGNMYAPAPVHNSIYDFIAEWEDSWPLQENFFPEDPTLISQAITAGIAVMVSDGSYKPLLSTELGAVAWIIECSQTSAVCFGEWSTLGLQNEINAYRSELQGCHAGLLRIFCVLYFSQSTWWIHNSPF
jgi:hypothetical protein